MIERIAILGNFTENITMESILFFFVYVSILTLPGLALWTLLKQKEFKLLASIGISYIAFTLTFAISNYFSLSPTTFIFGVLLTVVASIIVLFVDRGKIAILGAATRSLFLISGLSLAYQIIIGAFVEVPADLYSHLERYQNALREVETGGLGDNLSLKDILLQRSGAFYYLIALANLETQVSARSLVEIVDFANRTLFLLSIYSFAQFVFPKSRITTLTAALTVALISLHMGISVFAYVRYYTFAPTMLAMVLYFFAIAVFLRSLQHSLSLTCVLLQYSLIFVATLAMAIVHTQEALFTGVMVATIAGIYAISQLTHSATLPPIRRYPPILIVALAFSAITALYIYSHLNLPRAPNAHWRLWDFGGGLGLLPKLTILNLKNEFISVVTLWGLFVYVLFFVNFHRYRKNYFILAGMLSPLVTFLNPFFIDLFLRHYNSTTVWRLCYLLPIHFVAADLIAHYSTRMRSSNLARKVGGALALIGLIALLLPFPNNTTRLATLQSSQTGLAHQHYVDLLDYLESIRDREIILTDPMTGYMISGLTKHSSNRRKFFRSNQYKHFSFYDYSDNPLDKYAGHLLIVNQRQKPESRVGDISGHWRKDEWIQTKNYYPDALLEHLETRSDRFQKLWENAGITIFRIRNI